MASLERKDFVWVKRFALAWPLLEHTREKHLSKFAKNLKI